MQILNFDSHRCRSIALSLRTQALYEFINVQISNAFIFPCLEQILNVVLSNFTPKGEQWCLPLMKFLRYTMVKNLNKKSHRAKIYFLVF